MKNSKFDKLFNTIMEEAKKPTKKAIIKENVNPKVDKYWAEVKADPNWQGAPDMNEVFGAIDRTIKANRRGNPTALKNLLLNFVNDTINNLTDDSDEIDFYELIIEGTQQYNVPVKFEGLTDPETFRNIGYVVAPEDALILKSHYADMNDGMGDWDHYDDDQTTFDYMVEDWGLKEVADRIQELREDNF